MRLINATTLQLEGPYFGSDRPSYAILSHTWGGDELSLQDMARISKQIYKEGFKKIARCCARAQQDGITHIWVDTVCIDKTSSAELSEAINSMYNWYARAEVCYILLEDYVPETMEQSSALKRCRWFTRGWTLQELIAPRKALFFNQKWHLLGQKSDPEVTKSVSLITGIDGDTLEGLAPRRLGVAQRMSWAAERQTSRPEDSAYCLLGIFGINMPMLYGEGGENAFRRLQEEILKKTDDQSIFAWRPISSGDPDYWGLLAPSPSCFANSAGFRPLKVRVGQVEPNLRITSRGISLNLPVDRTTGRAAIACLNQDDMICILSLIRLGSGPNDFARGSSFNMANSIDKFRDDTVLFRLDVQSADFRIQNMSNYMRVSFKPPPYFGQYDFVLSSAPPEALDRASMTIRTSPFLQDRAVVFAHFRPWSATSDLSPFCLGIFLTGVPETGDYVYLLRLYERNNAGSTTAELIHAWEHTGRPMGLPEP